jgi:hypothetical protein
LEFSFPISIALMNQQIVGGIQKLAGSENPKKKLRFFLRELAG